MTTQTHARTRRPRTRVRAAASHLRTTPLFNHLFAPKNHSTPPHLAPLPAGRLQFKHCPASPQRSLFISLLFHFSFFHDKEVTSQRRPVDSARTLPHAACPLAPEAFCSVWLEAADLLPEGGASGCIIESVRTEINQ